MPLLVFNVYKLLRLSDLVFVQRIDSAMPSTILDQLKHGWIFGLFSFHHLFGYTIWLMKISLLEEIMRLYIKGKLHYFSTANEVRRRTQNAISNRGSSPLLIVKVQKAWGFTNPIVSRSMKIRRFR
ncbi:hypothetical protein KO02_21670 [Sphingobacterium sp. ML3W]|nr:hypothetical protein KO02_21670 [Sphingobacterium sp. ML3W]